MRVPGLNGLGLTGGERVARRLAQLGCDCVFSIAGSQTLPIADALAAHGIRLVTPRTERHGAFMAEGFARASGRPAVLMDTLGPGVANELPGLESARLSAAPILSICPGQPAWKRPRIAEVFQGLDHSAYFATVCKATRLVDDADELEAALDEGYSACATAPAGPVRVDVSFPLLFARSRRPAAHEVRATVPAHHVDTSPLLIAEAPVRGAIAPGLPAAGALSHSRWAPASAIRGVRLSY